MTDDYDACSSIHDVRMMFISIPGIVPGAGTPALLDTMGRKNRDTHAVAGAIGALIIPVSMMAGSRASSQP